MLQIGNFQIVCVVLSVLAMVALDRQRNVLGGALLALTILSKISPGILALTLLLQRRFRAAAYCAGFGVLLLGVSALWFGFEPIQSFQSFALPRLSSGTAFPFMDTEAGIVTNLSPFGIAFKLPLFGIDPGDPWLLGRVFARVYACFLLLLTVATARRSRDRVQLGVTWMALLALASMQSPFAPGYVAFGLLWATTLLATRVRNPAGIAGIVGLWIFALVVPPDLSVTRHAVLSLMQGALVVGVSTWLVVRGQRHAGY
jgi:hypothetical protein